jgi:hypothetical protein
MYPAPKTSEMGLSRPCGPWLSILLPVYNVEPYLAACIESIMQQLDPQLGDIEVLALDDVSTDGSLALLQRLQQSHPSIKILRHAHNQGLSAARNSLLEAARGRHLWFVDSDDALMPGALASLASIVQTHDPDLVLCDFRTLRERFTRKHARRGELHRHCFAGPAQQLLQDPVQLLQGLLLPGQLHSWSKIAKRSLYADHLRFPHGRYYEDMATSTRLALQAQTAYYAPEVWLGYRQRDNSILATLSPAKLRDLAANWPEMATAVRLRLGLQPQARWACAQFVTRSLLGAAPRAYRQRQDPAALRELAARYREALQQLELQPRDMVWAFIRRGWLWRALRLQHWLRRLTRGPRP